MDDEFILSNDGKPYFRPVFESLNSLDWFNTEVTETSYAGLINEKKPNSFFVSKNLSYPEMCITSIHEIHHLLLDDALPYNFESWVKSFPNLGDKIALFSETDDMEDFPVIDWYRKILNGGFRNDWGKFLSLRIIGINKEDEVNALVSFARLCREEMWDISSYNIVKFLEKYNFKKYSQLENKLIQAHKLYKRDRIKNI